MINNRFSIQSDNAFFQCKKTGQYQEKEGSERKTEQQWARQICIVHNVAVHRSKRVENGE